MSLPWMPLIPCSDSTKVALLARSVALKKQQWSSSTPANPKSPTCSTQTSIASRILVSAPVCRLTCKTCTSATETMTRRTTHLCCTRRSCWCSRTIHSRRSLPSWVARRRIGGYWMILARFAIGEVGRSF